MIELDVKADKLPALLDEATYSRLLSLLADQAAEIYTEDVVAFIRDHNISKSGGLESQIGWRPEGNKSLVFTRDEWPAHLEYGTKPHIIRPKDRKALRIPTEEGYVFAKQIDHPGTSPVPFFFADQMERQKNILSVAKRTILSAMD